MATYHEMLAIIEAAEKTHIEAHGRLLEMGCFLRAIKLNARALGSTTGNFKSDFRHRLPKMVKKGWVWVHGDNFALTAQGRAQLDEWNRLGCKSHQTGKGSRGWNDRKCEGGRQYKSPDSWEDA